MKLLGIYRHAKSDWDDAAKRDFDRGLNARGARGAELMGEHIREYGVRWDAVLASTAVRVRDTLELGSPELEPVWSDKLYLASAPTWLDFIAGHAGEARSVLICGHNPGLQELLFALVPKANENDLFFEAARKFPTAAFAVVRLDIDDWDQLEGAEGEVVHFARPRDLDASLGPEIVA